MILELTLTSKMARWFPRAGHVNDIKTSGPRQMVPLKSNKSLTKYPSSFPAQLSKDSNNTRSTYAIENIKHVPNHSREAVGPGHREDRRSSRVQGDPGPEARPR